MALVKVPPQAAGLVRPFAFTLALPVQFAFLDISLIVSDVSPSIGTESLVNRVRAK